MFYAYVLKSVKHDYFYKGHCENLQTRMAEHNAGMTTSIKPYIPFEIVYFEEFNTREELLTGEDVVRSCHCQNTTMPFRRSSLNASGETTLYFPLCCPSAISSTIFLQKAGKSRGSLLVTRPLSTTTSWSTHFAPALVRSVLSEG